MSIMPTLLTFESFSTCRTKLNQKYIDEIKFKLNDKHNNLVYFDLLLIHYLKMKSKAVNVIKFNAKGLILLCGELSIEASFKIASRTVKSPPLCLVTFS